MNPRNALTEPWLLNPLPHFGELDPAGYADLGLKSGLEVHQQLLTQRKLFCRCPAGRYSLEHQAEVLRHMRPTLSEMGEYDGTALMEFKTRKDIVYLLNNETVCTYEMDDAPPFEIDDLALDRSIAIARLLGCNIVSEVHITRKQYLDGSIPTGFQRTAIVGTDGAIPYRGRSIRIRQISLEEDSCREVADRGHLRTYRTDRLGMPLIETVTDPDMRTPFEVMEVGQIIRWLARVSGLVRTGPGAARQDVNVSVTGGTRIEIKGVPSLRDIPRLVHNEGLRQTSLVAIQRELQRRGVREQDLPERFVDVTTFVRSTEFQNVRRAVEKGATVLAVPLPGFENLPGAPTQPRTTFLKEFSDRIRVIACIDELPNLACSTQDAPTFSGGEWDRITKACGVEGSVPVLVVWGRQRDAETAAREIVLRARDAVQGVPSETRQALDDGTNGFERILPGADRMYPDTDLPPIPLEDARLDRIFAALPERPWERREGLERQGVGADLADRLSRHPAYDLFQALVGECGDGLSATGLASLLLDRSCPRPASLKVAGDWWRATIRRLAAGEIVAEGIYLAEGDPPAVERESAARRRFAAALATVPEGPREGRRGEDFVMGHVMPGLRGRIAGRTVRTWVKEALA
ncbi:MAG TPA: Glu-tRNA(Gln) amidotransferase subunit GatE [Candidatus Krumholzibacteria bacterium]|nr:Glu-tRNA(Gln) amidotransferase subunit GatE [Candidatus Krumholzibacteria bacterium]HPD72447.1 Glu-tRNA(Gln) amidotransferase subunit GatE [Candidatus Krumholzibacteria bacterium]HRY40621.1 Glu-tRNA(Gln) amidotransferase subunit GatE [Candidatus Krumholzibacteria bacterium]